MEYDPEMIHRYMISLAIVVAHSRGSRRIDGVASLLIIVAPLFGICLWRIGIWDGIYSLGCQSAGWVVLLEVHAVLSLGLFLEWKPRVHECMGVSDLCK